MKDDDKLLQEAKEAFERAQDNDGVNYQLALDDMCFARLGDQWSDEDRKVRDVEGRPCLTVNKLPAFTRQVVNDARLNKPSITTHPVDSQSDPDTAAVINGLIRNIETVSSADTAYLTALASACDGGLGYFRITMDYAYDDVFDMDIQIERVKNPLTVHGDPHSTSLDGSDWNSAFVSEWIPNERFKKDYPNATLSDWEDSYDESWQQKDEVRVAEYWKRVEVERKVVMLTDGTIMEREQFDAQEALFLTAGFQVVRERTAQSYKVTQYIITGEEVLETNDWPGKYIPIVPVYGEEVAVEGRTYYKSLIRDAKDSQKLYNFFRSAQAESVVLGTKSPWLGPVGAFDTDSDKWGTANTENHAYLEFDGPIPPQRINPPAVNMAAVQEALTANDEIKAVIGMHDASLGARSNEVSGRAIMVRQREGDISTFHFMDNLSKSIRQGGRILVDLIPKVYDKPRMIRVLGQEEESENVQINKRFNAKGEDKIYDLTTGKYDVTVRSGPSFTSKREEAATQMIELLRNFPQAAPVIGDLLAKNLDWPGADEIAKRLKS
ncbi:portal protein [Solemya elarraichensis gill symbiont]|uniref:Portal protein n=1 Tax=Solemya elarraichensis gill symbiont TaxID=1918949 RepID=A0A1T2KZS8_9GAMM|nr:portal protein [Solemya elarraichensis gill symbiont]OOZ38321.1 hypothetical protein BOW52_08785 [Solemya elarraichensis gill symbiont]